MGAKLDSKIGLYFTYQSGPIFRAKTDVSDLQCIYFITEILFCWNEEGNLVEALFFVYFSIFPLKSWRNFIRSKTAELKFMDDAELVACVQPPPPASSLLFCWGKGGLYTGYSMCCSVIG